MVDPRRRPNVASHRRAATGERRRGRRRCGLRVGRRPTAPNIGDRRLVANRPAGRTVCDAGAARSRDLGRLWRRRPGNDQAAGQFRRRNLADACRPVREAGAGLGPRERRAGQHHPRLPALRWWCRRWQRVEEGHVFHRRRQNGNVTAADPPRGGIASGIAAASDAVIAIPASSGASEVYRSGDAGKTWQTPLQQGDGGVGYFDVGFTTATQGVAVYGQAWRTGTPASELLMTP